MRPTGRIKGSRGGRSIGNPPPRSHGQTAFPTAVDVSRGTVCKTGSNLHDCFPLGLPARTRRAGERPPDCKTTRSSVYCLRSSGGGRAEKLLRADVAPAGGDLHG